MPSPSAFPQIDIPSVDIWGLMFEREREFPDDKVIYRDVLTNRYYTFASLRRAALAFGQGLQKSWNWAKGDTITLFSPNSIYLPPVIYGTLYAGGIVSPANPAYSVDELSFQINDNETKAVATTKSLLPVVIGAAQKIGLSLDRIILLDERDSTGQFKHFEEYFETPPSTSHARVRIDPDNDLSFLVYSSGTTGLPKGVMLSHRNIVSNVLMVSSSIGKSYSWENDKVLGILPFYHIYGLTCLIHQPIYRGIEMVSVPRFELKGFLSAIQNHRITFVYVAPPVLVQLANSPIAQQYDLTSLRMVTSGAAPLTRELIDAVHQRLNIKINQAYGLSETSPITHMQPWDEWNHTVSIGKLMPNLSAVHLSPDGDEVPVGSSGELCLKGPNVFKGYWKNKEGTDKSFTPNGFYKTGDVGHEDEKGNFYITDRVKELIKYKGFQVAPAELEGLLLSHPAVNDVAVVGISEDHNELPRAYIVAAEGVEQSDATSHEIIQWMDAKVAHHKKLRGGIRFIERIPKTATGKILRKDLKEVAKREQSPVKAKL